MEYRSYDYKNESFKANGVYVQRVLAAKAPDLFFHVSAHGSKRMDWRLDPKAQYATLTSDRAYKVSKLNRTCFIQNYSSGAPLPGSLPNDLFFHATGIYPLSGKPAPKRADDGESPAVLRDICESPLFNFVRPHLELVDGRWCHVLERPGADVLWLDVEQNCALLAREFYDLKTGDLMVRYECGGHREVNPGIWLPSWIRNIHYDFRARAPSDRKQTITDAHIKIIKAEANTIENRHFEYSSPPGVLMLNSEGAVPVQSSKGGLEHFDELIKWSQTVLANRWIRNQNSVSFTPFLWATGGFFLTLFASSLVRQLKPKSTDSTRKSSTFKS